MVTMLVPFAMDGDRRITPDEATPKTKYHCPECGGVLYLRSRKKAPHFYHHKKPDHCGLNEGIPHVIAKHSIKKAVLDALEGIGKTPSIKRTCRTCGNIITQPLPLHKITRLEFEKPIHANGSIIRFDVALINQKGSVVCGVEVYHKHRVDEKKRERLSSINIPWLEVKAEEIIQNPLLWQVRESGGLNPFCCEIRRKRAKQFRIIQRGMAIHVDGCPRAARVWRGKPYANVIDDCAHCDSFCGLETKERFDPKAKEWTIDKEILYCDPIGGRHWGQSTRRRPHG